jgi:uncharacterized protein YoxC
VPDLNMLQVVFPAIVGVFGSVLGFWVVARRVEVILPPPEEISSRVASLTAELRVTAAGLDNLVSEMADLAAARARNVASLEASLSELEARKAEMEAKIADVAKVTPLAVDVFSKMLAERDQINTNRDLKLFIAGAVLSAVVTAVVALAIAILVH